MKALLTTTREFIASIPAGLAGMAWVAGVLAEQQWKQFKRWIKRKIGAERE